MSLTSYEQQTLNPIFLTPAVIVTIIIMLAFYEIEKPKGNKRGNRNEKDTSLCVSWTNRTGNRGNS